VAKTSVRRSSTPSAWKRRRCAGTPVESLYSRPKATVLHRGPSSEYYDKLLAFLARSLGGKTATAAAPAAGKDKAP
jgi:hypothetical protein